MINILRVEKSPNDRACCFNCGKILQKGTTRVVFDGTYFNHPSLKYACFTCGLEEIKKDKDAILKLLEDMQKCLDIEFDAMLDNVK
jgi:hypothetical protein